MKGIAILLARAGSKGLPNKNIALLRGKPLIYYSLEVLNKNEKISEIIVSTDGQQIKKVVEGLNFSKVKVFKRPMKYSGDKVTTRETLKFLYSQLNDTQKSTDFFVYSQVTEPLKPKDILEKCIHLFENSDHDSVFAAYKMHKNLWEIKNDQISLLTKKNQTEAPRQVKSPIYREDTGICCVISPEIFASGRRIGDNPGLVSYDDHSALIDIHERKDLELADFLMEK